MRKGLTLCLSVLLFATALPAQPRGPYLVVDDKAAGIPVQPTMYGIFLEDINFAADGGLIVKIANVSAYSQVVTFDLPGGLTGAERTSLHSDNPMDENTLDEPERVVPVTAPLDLTPVADPANEWLLGVRHLDNGRIAYSERLGGRTFAVYRFHRK